MSFTMRRRTMRLAGMEKQDISLQQMADNSSDMTESKLAIW